MVVAAVVVVVVVQCNKNMSFPLHAKVWKIKDFCIHRQQPLFLCSDRRWCKGPFKKIRHTFWPILDLIHTRHFDAQYFDIAIFFSCVNWKYSFLNNSVPQMSMENHHWCLWFEKILKCNYNILTNNMSFYLFIAMSFSILCAKILCVNWALDPLP